MSNVYKIKLSSDEKDKWGVYAKSLLETLIQKEEVRLAKSIPLKVHFGEKGNKTFIPATTFDPIIDFLQDENINSEFIETNVLYRGQRQTATNHIRLAKEHGFTRLPIHIADGEYGDEYTSVPINGDYCKEVKIGKGYAAYEQVLVLSHFKGHSMAGFGGALKMLAMGFASRGGKLDQHSKMIPKIIEDKCIACNKCVEKCGVNAIDMEQVAHIHEDLCVGCAGCIAVCPVGAVAFDWAGINFKKKIAEYAYGAAKDKRHIYINFAVSITKECDCMGQAMEPIAKDLGIYASLDPVAIDAACLDDLQRAAAHDLFEPGRESLDHAEEMGLGTSRYILINCDI